MGKHIFWGLVALALATMGSYVGLTVAGYPDQAESLVGFVVLGAVVLAMFFGLFG